MSDTKKCGGWIFQVNMDAMPEKIATAFGELNEHMIGAKYKSIAYLGSQVVNGTNYAVLCKTAPSHSEMNDKATLALVYVYEDLQGTCTITSTDAIVLSAD